MRFLLGLSFILLTVFTDAQTCTSNFPLNVNVCKGIPNDSVTVSCIRSSYGLMASDSNFTIISYTVTASGKGFDDVIYQAPNQGSGFNIRPRQIINILRQGSFIEFSCIKAYYKNDKGVTYILQPLFIELK